MWQKFSPNSRAAILRAQNIALARDQNAVSQLCLFLALLDGATPDSSLGALLHGTGLKLEEARLYVEAMFSPSPDAQPTTEPEPKLTFNAKRVLEFAAAEARDVGDQLIEPEHLLLACLRPQAGSTLEATLEPLGWNLAALRAKRRELSHAPSSRHPGNPLEILTSASNAVVESAYNAMRSTYGGRISTAHLLLALLDNEHAAELLTATGASVEALKTQTRASIRSDSQLATPEKRFDKGAKRALDRAKKEAQQHGYLFIAPDHLLLGLLPQNATLREKLTWGTQVTDEAALLLAELDAQKLRDTVAPRLKKSVPRPKALSTDVPRTTSTIAFASMFVAGLTSGFALAHSRTLAPALAIAGIVVFLVLLLTSALGTCWMLLTSHKPNLKSAWSAAFFGFLLGMMLTALIFVR